MMVFTPTPLWLISKVHEVALICWKKGRKYLCRSYVYQNLSDADISLSGTKTFLSLFIPFFYYLVLPKWQEVVNEGDLTREITDFVYRQVEHKP